MSEEEFDREVLEGVPMDRRTFVKRVVLGTAFAIPVVASFPMSGLADSPVFCGNGTGDFCGNGSPDLTFDRIRQILNDTVGGYPQTLKNLLSPLGSAQSLFRNGHLKRSCERLAEFEDKLRRAYRNGRVPEKAFIAIIAGLDQGLRPFICVRPV